MTPLFIWAHRGASAIAPENTMAAFRAAAEAGADGIELDVHLSRDGVPVVIHDETLGRTSNGRGAVGAFNVAELRRLDAGTWFHPAFTGERIPTLAEVLDWAGTSLRLNIEIKAAPAGAAVLDLLRAFPEARVLVSSFDHALLGRMRGWAPDLPLGFLSESRFWKRAVQRAAGCGAESFHPRVDVTSRPLLNACREAGLAVQVWTVDDPDRAVALQRLGVTAIFTNTPTLLCQRRRPIFLPIVV